MDNFPKFIRNVKKYESPKLAGCKINLPFNAGTKCFCLLITEHYANIRLGKHKKGGSPELQE